MRMMLVVDGRWKGKWRWCNPRPSHAPRSLPGLPTLARKPTCHAWESRAHVVSQSSSSSECSPPHPASVSALATGQNAMTTAYRAAGHSLDSRGRREPCGC